MAKQIVRAIVTGGKATAGPPLAPALAPLGINLGQVVAEINRKTASMADIDVPIKVIADPATKTFEVEVGSPPTAALIKKELGSGGSSNPKTEKVGNLPIDHVIKVAQAKREGLLSKDLKAATKEVLGTCQNMGILVDGKEPREVQKEIDSGKYTDKFSGSLQLLDPKAIKEMQKPFQGMIAAQKTRKTEAPAKAATPSEPAK